MAPKAKAQAKPQANPNEWFVKLVEDAQKKYKDLNEYVGDIINSIEFKDDAGQETKNGAIWKNQHHMPKRSRSCCDFVVPEEEENYDKGGPNRFLSVAYEDAPKFGQGKAREMYTEESKKSVRVRHAGYAYPGHHTERELPQDYLDTLEDEEYRAAQQGGIFPPPPAATFVPSSSQSIRHDNALQKHRVQKTEDEKKHEEGVKRSETADGSVMGDLAELLS